MKHYPQFTEKHVRTGMTGARGWVFYNWAVENETQIWGTGLKRTTKGYIAQEMERQRG